MKKLLNTVFLFQPDMEQSWQFLKKLCYWAWRAALLTLGGAAVGYITLLFAYGTYPSEIFRSYLASPELLVLNLLPAVWLMWLLYAVFGRLWVAFGIGGTALLALSLGNFFKILFRDDPIYFENLLILREAGLMADSYQVFIDKRIALAVLCVAAGTAVLAFTARGVLRGWKKRGALLLAALAAGALLLGVCLDDARYDSLGNYDYLEQWSPNQNYIAHGMLYPFLHSISDMIDTAPEGYDRADTERLLESYTDADIPEEKKVNLITIMREAYLDFSAFDIEGLDVSGYDLYHSLQAESYTGKLFTNIFAGGTIDTERCFLTGNYQLRDFRGDTNSYLWYLREQGYTVEGSHPYMRWFYNRFNVNGYLGFERYRFLENDYEKLSSARYLEDSVFYSEVYNDFIANKETGKPYFSFSLNIQSHGPYYTDASLGEKEYLTGNYTDGCKNAVDNYMDQIMQGDRELMAMVDKLRGDEEPVILVVFSDHLPWMGDGNEFYKEMGVDIDSDSMESLRARYQTDYLIWANDAAKKLLGSDFVGEGPTIAPCYLMNLVFEQCGWEGPAFMQAMDELREVFPVVSTLSVYAVDGEFVTSIPEERGELFHKFECLQYYWRNEFIYE